MTRMALLPCCLVSFQMVLVSYPGVLWLVRSRLAVDVQRAASVLSVDIPVSLACILQPVRQ